MVDSLRTLDVVFIAVSDSAVGNIFFKDVLVELGRDHVTVAVDASERLREVKEDEILTLGGTKLCFIRVPKGVVHLSHRRHGRRFGACDRSHHRTKCSTRSRSSKARLLRLHRSKRSRGQPN